MSKTPEYIWEVVMGRKVKSSKKITNDKVYHALGRKYPRLLLAVANEVHGTSYTGEEKVMFGSDEHYQQEQKGGVKKRVTDTHLVVDVQEESHQERLHFECQSKNDKRMSARMAEYDVLIALENRLLEGDMCNMELPRSTVVYLTGTEKTPKELIVHIAAPGGQLRYKIPTLIAFHYTMKELLERKLFLLIPFHILVYKNRIIGYNESEEALGELQKIYEDMVESLKRLRLANKLTADEVTDILRVSAEMVDKVAGKCDKVRKVLGDILRGQAYELPTDRLIMQGRLEGALENFMQMVQNLMQSLDISAEKACELLKVNVADYEAAKEKLTFPRQIN